MAENLDSKEKFLSEFHRFETLHANGLTALRTNAIQHFDRLGFPTSKNEEWKYTNIGPILKSSFSLPHSEGFQFTKEEIRERLRLDEKVTLVVVENGKLNLDASDNASEGIEIKSLRSEKNHPAVQKYFSEQADIDSDAFAALNTAFFLDGIFVRIQAKVNAEKPVIFVNVSSNKGEAVICHNRLLVVAEKNSEARIGWVTLSKDPASQTLVNAVVEIAVEENASLEFNIFQNENPKAYQVCNTYVSQERDSRFTINTATLGGNIVRNKLHIRLDAENCETHLYGLYVADEAQLIDNHTAVVHAKPNSNSNQLYKGIIGGKAHGVFNGKIFVEKDAQKTNAYQSNKNILLSNDAVINAKPQLEIFADDVKCTHGATTGQMDEESLFYLRSRGINEVNAKTLLNKAFASDILNNITIESLRESVFHATEEKLIKANA